jgi:hypothetical protein
MPRRTCKAAVRSGKATAITYPPARFARVDAYTVVVGEGRRIGGNQCGGGRHQLRDLFLALPSSPRASPIKDGRPIELYESWPILRIASVLIWLAALSFELSL